MRNLELTYSPYHLQLSMPFITSKGEIKERKGLVISLKNISKAQGIGEAAPLPEFGSESFEDDEKALENINLNLKLDLNNIIPSIESSLADFDHLPALRSGLEQAILNLVCVEKNTTLSELFQKPVSRNISVNGVIGILAEDEAVSKAKELRSKGFRTLKLKAGRENFEDEIEIIKTIRNAVGKNTKLRIDINGKWTPEEAALNLKQLEEFDLEYAEQPVKDINDFPSVSSATSIPLAADESVRSYDDAVSIIRNKLASVLILKPMMIGGLTHTFRIIDEAEKNGMKVVITSSFESSIGRSIAVFAAAVLKEQTAHGLAVHDYFNDTIVNNPFPVENGLIKIG
jgi:o-succinylbenzoate synthase